MRAMLIERVGLVAAIFALATLSTASGAVLQAGSIKLTKSAVAAKNIVPNFCGNICLIALVGSESINFF